MARSILQSAAIMGALSVALPHGVYAPDYPTYRRPVKPRPTGPTKKRAKVKAARKQKHRT
jgi:hypothetical protein